MAKGMYMGVLGVARKIKTPYMGVLGVGRKVKNAYIGVGGVARGCFVNGVKVSMSVGPIYQESMAYVTINGTTYGTTANTSYTVDIPIGTTITCFVKASMSGGSGTASTRANITVNGTTVAYTTSTSGTTYNYVVKGNASITMKYTSANLFGYSVMFGQLTITES